MFSGRNHRAGIALPSDPGHRELIKKIAPALKALNVVVFLVDNKCSVRKARLHGASGNDEVV